MNTIARSFVNASFISNYYKTRYDLTFLVVPSIAELISGSVFPRQLYSIPRRLKLAEPSFHLPNPVDALLTSQTTLSIMAVSQIKLQHEGSLLVLQRTTLGLIAAEGAKSLDIPSNSVCDVIKLDKLFKRFWIVEDFDQEPSRFHDEVDCEQHYVSQTAREASSRYIVRVPFRDSKYNLGFSKQQAIKRLHSLERRFQ